MVGRSKSFVAETCWSVVTASSAYAPTLSSDLAGRGGRPKILQPGTEWLAGDGAWWGVWQRLMRASYRVNSGPRRAHLRLTSPIFLVSAGERKVQEAVAVVVE